MYIFLKQPEPFVFECVGNQFYYSGSRPVRQTLYSNKKPPALGSDGGGMGCKQHVCYIKARL